MKLVHDEALIIESENHVREHGSEMCEDQKQLGEPSIRSSRSRQRHGKTCAGRRDRSRSRNRSCNQRQERRAASGNSIVNCLNVSYDRIYKNDDFFTKQKVFGQFIIVDSGCP